MTLTPGAIEFMAQNAQEPYDVENVKKDLVALIEDHIKNRPRSKQRVIGPSEIGHECGRWLAYKLMDTDVLNEFSKNRDQWRTQVGVWVHEGLASVMDNANPTDRPMFGIEESLMVGRLSPIGDGEPEDIRGSGDLWYQGTVVDWKIVGPTTLKKCKTISRQTGQPHGASDRYRKQGHMYGKGWIYRGLPVHNVLIAFLPAAGDLRTDAFWHSEPFDPEIANAALARLDATNKLVNTGLPADQVLKMLPTAEAYCTYCPYFMPHAQSLSGGCPGGPKTSQRQDALFTLAAPN